VAGSCIAAKLRMLEFYYDFMDVFVDRRDFQYCAMDTDSAYMALSSASLEEVIKPDMQQRYQNVFHKAQRLKYQLVVFLVHDVIKHFIFPYFKKN
jgi:hypothetical protein